jgi:hypothetical protein
VPDPTPGFEAVTVTEGEWGEECKHTQHGIMIDVRRSWCWIGIWFREMHSSHSLHQWLPYRDRFRVIHLTTDAAHATPLSPALALHAIGATTGSFIPTAIVKTDHKPASLHKLAATVPLPRGLRLVSIGHRNRRKRTEMSVGQAVMDLERDGRRYYNGL